MPSTGLGYLYAGLRARRLASGKPVTILSCDNLLGNGDLTRKLLLQFAELKDPKTANWIKDQRNVSFPNSMVDRITPAVGPDTVSFVEEHFSITDHCPVISEDFRQWVIEDKFANDRPSLESIDGVLVVDDVKPYEILKTRLLNGSHSAMAYVAYLMGYRKVDQAINDPLILEFITRYMAEDVTPGLPEIAGVDVGEYKATLLKRFANPAISDQVERLAKDGSSKIAIYMIPALRQQLENGGSIRYISFALAAWGRYLRGYDEDDGSIAISDEYWDASKKPIASGKDLTSIEQVFGDDLAQNPHLGGEIDKAFIAIDTHGVKEALRRLVTDV